MSLGDVKMGSIIKINEIRDLSTKSHLIRFGIEEGTEVQCFQKIYKGPVVIKFNRQEIALGHELAKNILVSI
ncbi:MAG: ferrous iron transport protein A [Spirochaetota bacterium]|nr:ferrous iron transport protein A [Spirochaetota bacterium]